MDTATPIPNAAMSLTAAASGPAAGTGVPDEDHAATLAVLRIVERQPQVTQRRLSNEMGIALGLANAILKRCVRHGLIKISQAPFNRYSYYLTPTGFAEKSRLTVQHLRYSFNLFRNARTQYAALLRPLVARNAGRVALLGASELAEAAVLSARETGAVVVSVCDSEFAAPDHVGVPVVADFAALAGKVDALVLTDMKAPLATFDDARARGPALGFPADNVLAPDLLGVGTAREQAQ